jgi:hypothetical protein
MDDITNPHDRYFRESFSRIEVARDFLRHNLPAALLVEHRRRLGFHKTSSVWSRRTVSIETSRPWRSRSISHASVGPKSGLCCTKASLRLWANSPSGRR